MTEKEKMLSGEFYDCGDAELIKRWHVAKKLLKEYNQTSTTNRKKLNGILTELLGSRGKNLWITAPFFCDYGENIHFGDNCEVNFNCVFLDCNRIVIGNNALIAPNVQIYTVFHPVVAESRLCNDDHQGFPFIKAQTLPVILGNNVWIGGGAIILPGVSIGDNTTIGAGSVVTSNIPDHVLAFGNPCKVIRKLK